MLVKVCGMRNPQNIKQIANLDIHFMGFIFYEKSKRFVADLNPNLIDLQSDKIKRVGVFVNEKTEIILDFVEKFRLDYIQLHGDETPEFCELLSTKVKIIKAFQIHENFDFNQLKKYSECCNYFVFDTKSKGYGGSGQKFNWQVLDNYKLQTPFLLSGGIQPEDAEIVKIFKHPTCIGIDLNSGFEDEPGLKNYEKLKIFLNNFTTESH